MSDYIYVKSQASIKVAHDSQFLDLEYAREDATISEQYLYQESGTIVIAGGATAVINLGSITEVKSIFIETESQINVTIDGADNPIDVRPGSTTGKGRLIMDCVSVASLSITNPISGGSGTGRVSYQIAGD